MNDFTDLMEAVRRFGHNVNLVLNHYGDFVSENYNDGFQLQWNNLRLQFIRLENDEIEISRGAVFAGEEINFKSNDDIQSKIDQWTLYRGAISEIPTNLFQRLLTLFRDGTDAEITDYYLDLKRIRTAEK